MKRRPWGSPPEPFKVGDLFRMPDGRAFVVAYVNYSRARVHPLTPIERQIVVHERGKAETTTKDVQETGNPIDISPNSGMPRIDMSELTDAEFNKLTRYIESGGQFNE